MPAFAFSARPKKGKDIQGVRVVDSEAALAQLLAGEGLFLLQAKPAATLKRDPKKIKLSSKDLSTLLLHLATYLEAGLSITAALQDYRDPDRPGLEAAVLDMAGRIYEGSSLSEVMEAYPRLFPAIHVSMVRAGEATGRLDQALRAVIKLVEWNEGFRSQVRKASTYPLILISVLGLIILLVSIFSLPAILKLLEDLDVPLPLVTQVFLAGGKVLAHFGWLLALVPVVGWIGLKVALRNPAFRLRWDTLLLNLPMAGRLFTRMAMAQFAHFFAEQHRAGLPVLQALRNSEDVTGNARIGMCIRTIRLGVEQGEGLAVMATQVGYFPQIVIRMMAIGEQTGRLEETLAKIAAYFDAEVAEGVDTFFKLLDPVIKVVMACLLVFVAAAVLLPLYMLVGGING
jgi:type II secretory pathway component PulF